MICRVEIACMYVIPAFAVLYRIVGREFVFPSWVTWDGMWGDSVYINVLVAPSLTSASLGEENP